MNLKKILPMKWNFELRNFREYFKKPNINVKKPRRTIYFLDAASYGNLGDQAIAYSMSVMLKDLARKFGYDYLQISEINLLRNIRLLKKLVLPEDILCLSGGGNMGNLYPKYESIRRKIIGLFPNNTIIIFPQTIDYEDDSYGRRELQNAAKIYGRHNRLFVFAREKKSYELMSAVYKNVMLVPDIVLSLCGKDLFGLKNNSVPERIGVCLRHDKEAVLSEREREDISAACSDLGYSVKQLTTMSEIGFMTDDSIRFNELKKKLEEFKSCRMIITDRLHGMVFSVLAEVPCIAIDNSNKKVSGVLETAGNIDGVIMSDGKNIKKEIEKSAYSKACVPDFYDRFCMIEKIIKGEIK